jgi:hypothetical protein
MVWQWQPHEISSGRNVVGLIKPPPRGQLLKELKMNRLTYEAKIAKRCKAASEFLGAIVVGCLFGLPFIVEIIKELAK